MLHFFFFGFLLLHFEFLKATHHNQAEMSLQLFIFARGKQCLQTLNQGQV